MSAKHQATAVCKAPYCYATLSGESDESIYDANYSLIQKAKEAGWRCNLEFYSSAMGGGSTGSAHCPSHKQPPKHHKRAHKMWKKRMELAECQWPVALCFQKKLGATTTMVYYDYHAVSVGPYASGVVYEVPDDEAERLVRDKQFKVRAS